MIVKETEEGKEFNFNFHNSALRAQEMKHHPDVCGVRAEIAEIIISLEHSFEELDEDFDLDKESDWYGSDWYGLLD